MQFNFRDRVHLINLPLRCLRYPRVCFYCYRPVVVVVVVVVVLCVGCRSVSRSLAPGMGPNENEISALGADAYHMQGSRQKRMRTSFKHHQIRTMKSYFSLNHNPDAKDLKQLAQKTGLNKRILQVRVRVVQRNPRQFFIYF